MVARRRPRGRGAAARSGAEVPVVEDRLAVGGQPCRPGAGRRSCPSARRTRSCRRSRDRSGRARGGRCRRSSRRTGSRRSGRSMPKFVPIPSSPEDAGAVVGLERGLQVAVAALGARRHDAALAELERRRPRRPRRAATVGIVKRTRPSAEVSCGPVKTSPLGMLRLPSELTQVRPSTFERQVGARAPRCGSRSRARGARSAAPGSSRSSPHAAAGSSRSRNSARVDEGGEVRRAHARLLGGGGGRPQRDRPAARRARSRAAACARGRPRASRAGIDARQRVRVVGGLDPQRGVDVLGLGELGRGKPSRCGRARALQKPLVLAGQRQRAAAATPRARAPRAGARAAAARRASSRARAPAGPAAPRGSSRSAGARRRRCSRGLQVREVLGEVRAQRVADPAPLLGRGEAIAREQLLLARRAARCRRSPSAPRGARRGTRRRAARRPRARAGCRPRPRRTACAWRASSSRAARAASRARRGTRTRARGCAHGGGPSSPSPGR